MSARPGTEAKLFAFDCDGTLMDTIPDYLAAMNKTLLRFGLPPITKSEAMSFLGNGTDAFVKASLKGRRPAPFDQVKDFYLREYESHFFVKTKVYPGIVEFLRELKQKGKLLGICSNKPDFILKPLVEKALPEIRFDFIGGQKGAHRKPNPYLLDLASRELSTPKEEIAFFGDTEVDEAFARNASVGYIFIVTYGFRSPKRLADEVKPTAFFDDVASMASYFE